MHVVWRRIWDDIFIIFYHFKPVGQCVGKIILTQLVSEWVETVPGEKGRVLGWKGSNTGVTLSLEYNTLQTFTIYEAMSHMRGAYICLYTLIHIIMHTFGYIQLIK